MIPNSTKIKFTLLILFAFSFYPMLAHGKHILVYGDSLSAAYGMDLEQGWVHLLALSLGEQHRVSNASISGDTSARGRDRLQVTLNEFKPDIILLELGANDGLQGLPIKNLRENLESMIQQVKAAQIDIVLGGISLPASYGPRYIDQFRAVYTDLAAAYDLPLLDFYREEFVTTPGYIQEDGLHPTAITQPLVRDIVLAFLKEQELIN